MKKNLLKKSFLIITCLVLAVFTSCKKDDPTTPNPGGGSTYDNYLKIGDVSYPLNYGVIEYYGLGDAAISYKINLTLLGPDGNDAFNVIRFNMFSPEEQELPTRTYNYSDSEKFGTFDFGRWLLGVDTTGGFTDHDFIDGGKITIDFTNGIYTFRIDCIDENNVPVTGYYKGTVEHVDGTGPSTGTGLFVADNQTFMLTCGRFDPYSDINQFGAYDIDLYLSGVNDDGTINEIGFELFSTVQTYIPDGIYLFSLEKTPNTFDDGEWKAAYNLNNYECYGIGDLNGGYIQISETENLYNVVFVCTDENGKEISGSYNGLLPFLYGNEKSPIFKINKAIEKLAK